MTLEGELKALNVMNNSRLWLASMTPGHKLRASDATNWLEL